MQPALMASRLPKLIAFDLECVLYSSALLLAHIRSYTLWPLWIDTHIGCKLWPLLWVVKSVSFLLLTLAFFVAPLTRDGDSLNEVHDRYVVPRIP